MANRALVLIAALVMLLTQLALAAFEFPVGSVSSFAEAGNVNLHHPTALDLYLNPALKCTGKMGLDLSLSRLYNLEDFQLTSGAVAVNHGHFSAGVGMTQLSGADYYWERSYLLAAAIGLPHQLRAGVAINHLRLEYTGGYQGLSLTAVNLGTVWTASNTMAFAATARNLNQPHYGSGTQALPMIGEVSVSYVFSEAFSFHLTHHLEKKVHDRTLLGQQVNITKEFALHLGLGTEPTEISGGFSLGTHGLMFDYGFRDNVYLGGTHRFGLRIVR